MEKYSQMSDGGKRAFAVACKYAKKYEDATPEVGMGTFAITVVKDVAKEAGISLTAAEAEAVAEGLR